ncbi:Hypothetical predicted protein [Xyrichtys novacula]|nr:Hypothetical predicted protein [Xyrichtys novacula]
MSPGDIKIFSPLLLHPTLICCYQRNLNTLSVFESRDALINLAKIEPISVDLMPALLRLCPADRKSENPEDPCAILYDDEQKSDISARLRAQR